MQNNNNIRDKKNTLAYRVIMEILNEFKINSSEFCQRIGVNPSFVSDAKNGKTRRISEQVADKIIEQWPELSKIWLLTGEGQKKNSSYQKNTEFEKFNKEHTPMENNGIFINHGGGGDTYNNNPGLMQLVFEQQKTIRELVEHIRTMSITVPVKAKLQCDQSVKYARKILKIKNVGGDDALNIRFKAPECINVTDGQDLFPFPKMEAGRSIELCYDCLDEIRPSYIPLDFFYEVDGVEQKYTFYLTL